MTLLQDIEFADNPISVAERNFEAIDAQLEGFTFTQGVAAMQWGPVAHGLGYIPTCVSVYINGMIVPAPVWADGTNITVKFAGAYSGTIRAR